jgi:hypothetical protein
MWQKNKIFALTAIMLGVFASDVSPTELTTLSVSLLVQESCEIESGAKAAVVAKPSVSCLHGQPYDITFVTLDPVQPISTEQHATRVSKQSKAWMVDF